MATYERSDRVAAPLAEVWAFHSTERGLVELTPDWMGLHIESVRGPDGEPDPEVLEVGSTLDVSVRPFGVGPRQGWTSEITEREHDGTSAYFRDVMREGPFEHWEHTHSFFADGDETVFRDTIEYQFPLGRLGETLGLFGVVGFEPMFRYRHWQTKRLLG